MGARAPLPIRFALLVSLAGLAAPLSRATAQQQDTALVDVALQVHVEGGLDSFMIALMRPDSTVLLPLRELLDLLEIRATAIDTGRSFAARLGEPPVPFEVNTAAGTARRGTDNFALGPGDAAWRGGELFVATGVLARLLDIEIGVDWLELAVRLNDTRRLPVVQRLARDRRRAVLQRAAQRPPEAEIVGGPPAFLDGLAVDWALNTATRQPLQNGSLQLGIGGTLLGGALDVLTTTTRSPTRTANETFVSWHVAWDDREWLRQVRVGDVTTGSPRAVAVQGGALTNVPFLRRPDFATEALVGRLMPGWEVEVYRGDVLVGYTPVDSLGGYGIGVPVVYGQNPVEAVAYGPHGEVRRLARTFNIPFERLPASRLEYNVGGGRCRSQCTAAANLDLRYGISSRITVEAGADQFWRDTLADLSHPYGLVNVALTRPLAFTAEAVARAFARTRLDLDPTPDFHADAGYTRFDTTVAAPLIGSATAAHQADLAVFWRPGILGGELFLQGGARYQTGASRTRRTARLGLTARVLGARFTSQARYDAERASGGRSTLAALDLGLGGVIARGPMRNTFARVSGSLECAGTGLGGCRSRLARWDAGLGRQLIGSLRLDVGLRKEAAGPLALDVTLAAAVPWMRATSRSTLTEGSAASGTQLFEGTVLWNRGQGRVDVSNGRNLGRAGVAGVVFLDANLNGIQDGGELGLPEVLLRVGTEVAQTDSLGRFRVWDLVPFVSTPIELDSLAMANPLWYPAVPVSRIVPSPNAFRFITLAVREGGEINGSVEFEGRPLPGATVVLIDSTERRREVPTFTDGTFYVMRLPPGVYTVTAAAPLLEALQARAHAVGVTVGISGSQPPEVVLRLSRR